MKQFLAMMMLVAGIGMMVFSASAHSLADDQPALHPEQSSSEIAEAIREGTESDFWISIRKSRDSRDFEEYLARYPDGDFVGPATRILDEINKNRARNEKAGTIPNQVVQFLLYCLAVFFLSCLVLIIFRFAKDMVSQSLSNRKNTGVY